MGMGVNGSGIAICANTAVTAANIPTTVSSLIVNVLLNLINQRSIAGTGFLPMQVYAIILNVLDFNN
jgi:hypothetical protein